ncbi:hypothetical protein ZWY2020_004533 [Hordeum vulgare]|nr:hypothetical protein ZWY2020_004533 [Hordeum vulgare]
MAPAPTTPSFLRPPPLHPHRIRLPAPPPSTSFRLSEILDGRGLCNGEVGIRKELLSPTPPSPPLSTPSEDSSSGGAESDPLAVDLDAFEKEMMGLTGGFLGGEVGFKDFVAKNLPPPPKRAQTDGKASSAVVPAGHPRPPELPLFLPGMVVLVINDSVNVYVIQHTHHVALAG